MRLFLLSTIAATVLQTASALALAINPLTGVSETQLLSQRTEQIRQAENAEWMLMAQGAGLALLFVAALGLGWYATRRLGRTSAE